MTHILIAIRKLKTPGGFGLQIKMLPLSGDDEEMGIQRLLSDLGEDSSLVKVLKLACNQVTMP